MHCWPSCQRPRDRDPLFRCHLELVIGEYEVLRGLRLMAIEAGCEIGVGVWGLVGAEGLIFPVAVADVLRIFRAPAGTLLHDRIAQNVGGLGKATVGIL